MNVKKLKEKLASYPDDALIAVEARGHTYREVDPVLAQAWVQQNGRGPIEEADVSLGTPLGFDQIAVLVFT